MRILVTAGPTIEPIDPVRFISNRSSGKMGYAVAEICRRRGHKVVLVSGPVSIRPPRGVRTIQIDSAAEMLIAVRKMIPWCDVLIMAAAVADFRPKNVSKQKVKKRKAPRILLLEKTVDILKSVRLLKKHRTYVGFAAETENLLREAKRKLLEKGVDLIVANDVSKKDSGFGTETNRVTFLTANGDVKQFPLLKKTDVAAGILDWIEANRGKD